MSVEPAVSVESEITLNARVSATRASFCLVFRLTVRVRKIAAVAFPSPMFPDAGKRVVARGQACALTLAGADSVSRRDGNSGRTRGAAISRARGWRAQAFDGKAERSVGFLDAIELNGRHRQQMIAGFEQIADVDRQRGRQAGDRGRAGIGFDAFDFAEELRGQASAFRELFLRQAALFAQQADASAEMSERFAIANGLLVFHPLAIRQALGHSSDYRDRSRQGHPLWVTLDSFLHTYG
jgi:hypothetical protein